MLIFFSELEYSTDILLNRLRELAFLNKGIHISFCDQRVSDEVQDFHFPGGLKPYIEFIDQNRKAVTNQVIYFDIQDQEFPIELAFQYNESYVENLYSFVNNVHTVSGGTHVAGFKTALTRSINNYIKQNSKAQKHITLSGDDVREGFNCDFIYQIS